MGDVLTATGDGAAIERLLSGLAAGDMSEAQIGDRSRALSGGAARLALARAGRAVGWACEWLEPELAWRLDAPVLRRIGALAHIDLQTEVGVWLHPADWIYACPLLPSERMDPDLLVHLLAEAGWAVQAGDVRAGGARSSGPLVIHVGRRG